MARPIKKGFDYFPLDTQFDDDVKLLMAECGHSGLSLLILLWQKIYRNSYFLPWNEDTALLFSREVNSELTQVNSVINVCFRRNLFSKTMYDNHGILTSAGIQRRYLEICRVSKRLNSSIEESYILVNRSDISSSTRINSELKRVNSELIKVNSEFSTQIKVNKIKVNKSKVSGQKFTPPTIFEITEFVKNNNLNVDPERFFFYYESNGWKVGKNSMKNWTSALRNWSRNNLNVKPKQINNQDLSNKNYIERL